MSSLINRRASLIIKAPAVLRGLWEDDVSRLPPDLLAMLPGLRCPRVNSSRLATTSGALDYSTPGSYNWTVPIHYFLTVQAWGAGGGGGAGHDSVGWAGGGAGGASSFNGGAYVAYGGGGGVGHALGATGGAGGGRAGPETGGGAGNNGGDGYYYSGGNGGTGASGGAGGGGRGPGEYPGYDGSWPGGGGGSSGGNVPSSYRGGGGGGGGGYIYKTWSYPSSLAFGSNLSFVVASGGAGAYDGTFGAYNGGAGAAGRIYISWS